MSRADLHNHTTASDGRTAPEDLVRKAHAAGLRALSITDHDTLDAYTRALPVAEELGIELLPGVELSASVEGREVHLLAYGVDLDDEGLKAHVHAYRKTRFDRARAMVDRLGRLGVPVPWGQVSQQSGGGVIGRPHVARALVAERHVATVQEAFERYLGAGCPAYVAKPELPSEQIVDLVHEAGGVCVLAHPGPDMPGRIIKALLEAGLDGIETHHPSHDSDVQRHYEAVCIKHDLIQTGGSDYHGPSDDGEDLYPRVTVPYRFVELIRAGCQRVAASTS